LREKVITEANDEMPSNDMYWNGAGIEKDALKNGLYLSGLTKEIEIIYFNSKIVT